MRPSPWCCRATTPRDDGDTVTRRASALTGGHTERLPGRCGECVFWELGAACPDAVHPALPAASGPLTEASTRKQAWISAQVQAGTSAGCVVSSADGITAYALFAPSTAFARRGPLVPATTAGSLHLATAYVRPSHRGIGLGRVLVHAAVREAIRMRLTSVEAYGDRWFRESGGVLPLSWLLHEGFVVHREHPRTPLLRLEVRRTVRWAASLEHALDEALGGVPRLVPEPAKVVHARVP